MSAARLGLGCLLVLAACAAGLAWLVPVETAQVWAIERAGADAYAQFEAAGRAEFLWWLTRGVWPAIVVALLACFLNSDSVLAFLIRAWREFLEATSGGEETGEPSARRPLTPTLSLLARGEGEETPSPRPSSRRAGREGEGRKSASRFSLRCLLVRASVVAWLVIAGYQGARGWWGSATDWPVYRLNAGRDVLPNISESNRDVIRYVEAATPENARIFVASDQKLFFLSYYSLPRRVYHRIHPESEFVIPLAHGARPLAAYRLEEIEPAYLDELKSDYVLEYFESDGFADKSRFLEDPNWVAFQRQRYGPDYQPTYLVRLSPYRQGVRP